MHGHVTTGMRVRGGLRTHSVRARGVDQSKRCQTLKCARELEMITTPAGWNRLQRVNPGGPPTRCNCRQLQ